MRPGLYQRLNPSCSPRMPLPTRWSIQDGEPSAGSQRLAGSIKRTKDGSRIDENYGGVSHFCLKAFVHLDVLAALLLFPLPAPKCPVEDTNRSDPYSGRTIACDDIAWVMHSQINA